jgi:hypothetical protein
LALARVRVRRIWVWPDNCPVEPLAMFNNWLAIETSRWF